MNGYSDHTPEDESWHLDETGLCVCPCDLCTMSFGGCVCPDCRCESMDDH